MTPTGNKTGHFNHNPGEAVKEQFCRQLFPDNRVIAHAAIRKTGQGSAGTLNSIDAPHLSIQACDAPQLDTVYMDSCTLKP